MTAVYDKLDIRFVYPENWQVTEDETTQVPRTVSLQSPVSGFWTLMVYDADADLDELMSEVIESMRAEYDSLEAEPLTDRFDDVEATGYEMYFYCLDHLVRSRVLSVRHESQALLVIWQATDQEFDDLDMVFRAMTTTLLNPTKYG